MYLQKNIQQAYAFFNGRVDIKESRKILQFYTSIHNIVCLSTSANVSDHYKQTHHKQFSVNRPLRNQA